MTPKAILFGAIGTLAETSEMQRAAFNAAFDEAGLDWNWGAEEYQELLKAPGGRRRIAAYAYERGEDVDAGAVHASKVRHFARMAEDLGFAPRSGVRELLDAARAQGVEAGFVTTTGRDTVELMFRGLKGAIAPEQFALVTDNTVVDAGKPDPAIYLHALSILGYEAGEVLAIEDTPESAAAAIGAGIATIGFPGQAARGRDFDGAIAVVDIVGPDILHTDLDRVA